MEKKIRKGDYIRYKDTMDVCLYVTKVFDYGHGLRIKGMWWNMAFETSYPIGYTVSLNFKKDASEVSNTPKLPLSDWQILRSWPTPECVRYGNWVTF